MNFVFDQATFASDAQQQLAFLVPQLYRINTEIEQNLYPEYNYADFMFVDTTGTVYDAGSVFYSGDIAGKAEFLSGAGFDMPFADISRSQFLQANHLAGIGYEYSWQELGRAAQLGQNLTTDKADAARRVAESFIYGIAIRGSSEKNFGGFINDSNVPTANVTADGTGSSPLWANKTGDQILRDLNSALNAPRTATAYTYIANTLVLPESAMDYLSSTPRTSTSDATLLAYFRENNSYTQRTGQPLRILGSRELETAGTGSTRRLVAYANLPGVVRFHLPGGGHQFLPVHQKGWGTWETPGVMNVGGTEIRRPSAMVYRDGF
ncbi:hypothetical protein ABIC65_001084 [Sphingomonas trueperi]|uniref:DUF2184 domain-containing protein n=1 Tax=Sphingomonas trueperi TaxID=53317 RepID=UPI0033951F13